MSNEDINKLTRKSRRSPLKNLQVQQIGQDEIFNQRQRRLPSPTKVSKNAPLIKKQLFRRSPADTKIKIAKPRVSCPARSVKIYKLENAENNKENAVPRQQIKIISKATISETTSTRKTPNIEYKLELNKVKLQKVGKSISPKEIKQKEDLLNTAILYDNKKVTYTRENFNLDIETSSDKEFVNAKLFFTDDKSGQINTRIASRISCNVSPIPKDLMRRSGSIEIKYDNFHIPSSRIPVEKQNLKEKIKHRHRKSDLISTLLLDEYYNTEYIEDIMTYLQGLEHIHNLSEIDADAFICIDYRFHVVNWILKISLSIQAPDSIFYLSMRLFNHIIFKSKLRKSSYMLAAITCFWIIHKIFISTNTIKLSKLFSLCSGKYSKEQIKSMEWDILRKIKFNLNVVDHNDFLQYYLWKLNFDNYRLMEIASHFVLDCCTLFKEFIVRPPSILSASAIIVAYQAIGGNSESIINIMIKWTDEKMLKISSSIAMECVGFIIKNNVNGPIDKYSTVNNLFVSNIFRNYFTSLSKLNK